MLEINTVALLIQIANFLILLFLLNKFLFKPIRAVLARRAHKFEDLSQTVESFEARAARSERAILEGRNASKKEGLSMKERLKAEAQEEERKFIDETMDSSERKVRDARKQLEASLASVRKDLESQAALLSKDVATRILGRSVS